MNHDRAHCADYREDCPKGCYRGELVRDLKRKEKDEWWKAVNWVSLKGTAGCMREEVTI